MTHLVSLGSVLAAATFAAGFAIFHWGNPFVVAGGVFMGGLTIFQHRANIARLLKGQEKKVNLFQLGKGK
jgi:glycerol-3-phosphate acyltransferase PlsY